MKWYENFFGFPFPFSKYDHVFCPEYNIGAMENAGVITVNDLYIFKDKVKLESVSNRAITIAHELAHSKHLFKLVLNSIWIQKVWFGDLVTMTWWSDLWY